MTEETQATLKIGLTMRVVSAIGYDETRDAIATDWSRFLSLTIPDISWIPLPNIGHNIIEYVTKWGLNGFIFTGGNDIGEVKIKDETDLTLLEHCLKNRLPAVGICRGLQLLQTYFGGMLHRCSAHEHVATHHSIRA